ncbi:hypothetical protein [Ascidiaceihabitans sp.]|uniref:hypothetical protein n=1 Tax=Ascidiaceihabitans sp. TaxID=1872644 RepID=UPI0032983922
MKRGVIFNSYTAGERHAGFAIGSGAEQIVLALTWVFLLIVVVTAKMLGAPVAPSGGIGLAFAVLSTLGLWSLEGKDVRASLAAMWLVGQAVAFTTAFAGHAWQVDTHMLFFALLAATGGLGSVPAIFATVVVIFEAMGLIVAIKARQTLLDAQVNAPGALKTAMT